MELPNYIGFLLVDTMNGPDAEGHVSLSVKAVPVDISRLVFCRECKYYRVSELLPPNRFCYRFNREYGINMADGDFCSVGERKCPCDA